MNKEERNGKSVPKDQGSEIIVPHRLMIFYSLDKGKEREKQKGILLQFQTIEGEDISCKIHYPKDGVFRLLLKEGFFHVWKRGPRFTGFFLFHFPLPSVAQAFTGKKLKEEDRKSVNNWCLSVFPFISICSYWFLSVSFSFIQRIENHSRGEEPGTLGFSIILHYLSYFSLLNAWRR